MDDDDDDNGDGDDDDDGDGTLPPTRPVRERAYTRKKKTWPSRIIIIIIRRTRSVLYSNRIAPTIIIIYYRLKYRIRLRHIIFFQVSGHYLFG